MIKCKLTLPSLRYHYHPATMFFILTSTLMYESDLMESESILMIGTYVQLVWDYVICKKKHLNLETLRSEYELKYFTHQSLICLIWSTLLVS